MNTNSSKLDASNQKRLESLRQKANEFKLKKETVRNDLSNLVSRWLVWQSGSPLKLTYFVSFMFKDSADGKTTSKRITFDSSSESEPEEKKPKSSVAKGSHFFKSGISHNCFPWKLCFF